MRTGRKCPLAAFIASTAVLARTAPRGVSTTTWPPWSRTRSMRVCSNTSTPLRTTASRNPKHRRAGCTVADGDSAAPPPKTGLFTCPATLVGAQASVRLAHPELLATAGRLEPHPLLRRRRCNLDHRCGAIPRVDLVRPAPLADRLHRDARRHRRARGPPPFRAPRRAGESCPSTRSRSRRSGRTARSRTARPRKPPRVRSARAPSGARQSRGQGSRLRRSRHHSRRRRRSAAALPAAELRAPTSRSGRARSAM